MFLEGDQRDAVLRLFMRYDVTHINPMNDYRVSVLSSRLHGANDTYLLEIHDKKFVIRVLDPLFSDLDRSVEQHNHQLMADAGLTWPFLLFDTSNGVKISEFFDGRMLNDADKHNPALMDQVMQCLSRLHHTDCLFREGHSPLKAYQSMADPCSVLESSAVLEGDKLVRALANMETTYRPCHQDVVLKNFVIEQDRVILIDWEFSSMGDPYYDFADFFYQNNLSQGNAMMASCARFLDDQNHFNAHKLQCYYYLSKLTWGLWHCRKKNFAKGQAILEEVIHHHGDLRWHA